MSYKIPQVLELYLFKNCQRGQYSRAYLAQPEKITGWKIYGQDQNIFSLPSLDKVREFERMQGWKLPESFVTFLTTFGRSVADDDYEFFMKLEDGREIKLGMFLGLIEMLPPNFGEYNYVRFCSASVTSEDSAASLTLNPQGQIGLRVREKHEIIAQSFEEFLEQVQVRQID